MKKITFSLLMILSFSKVQVQSQPIAAGLQKHVNLFTGDFNYSIPLMSVSGPNGESFPLQLNYGANIKTNQEASWVGLGWSLNLGEISRQVNGLPDDWKHGKYEVEKMDASAVSSTDKSYRGYGPVWFKDYNHQYTSDSTSLMDITYSRRKTGDNDAGFEFPDYDNFYVSGPGIGGKMRAYLFDYAHFHDESIKNYSIATASNFVKFTKDVQFRFEKDPSTGETELPYYHTNKYHGLLYKMAETTSPWLTGNLSGWDQTIRTPSWMASQSPPKVFTGDFNPNQTTKWEKRQPLFAANYIEYFTNDEIYKHHLGTELIPEGFIDFNVFTAATCDRDDAASYKPDGIGAFRVTTPNGMTYHYSLPVQVNSEENVSCAFDNVQTSPILKFDEYKKHTKTSKYAITWKLTAITGPDYEDVNSNKMVDDADKGYWVYINYEKWNKDTKSFIQRFPHYGFSIDKTYKNLPTSVYDETTYQLRGSYSTKHQDVYYPNYVKTTTQTLFFVKEIRDDAHSATDASNPDEIPRLRLKEIILLKNKDIADNSIFSSYSTIAAGSFSNLSSNANTNSMLHTGDYTGANTLIDPLSLGRISFSYDYSLCPKVYNNINNSVTKTTYKINGVDVFDNAISVTENAGSAGKLTLDELHVFGFGNQNLYGTKPAYQFDYGSSAQNPDYNHENQDFFGNYKLHQDLSNFDKVGYCTDSDKGLVSAWSLEKITNPIGGELNIEYEADNYSEVYYQNYRINIGTDPRRFFNFTCQGSNCSTLVFTDPNAIEFLTDPNIAAIELRIKFTCPGETNMRTETKRFTLSLAGTTNGMYSYDLTNSISSSNCPTVNLNNAEGQMMLRLNKVNGGGTRVKSISMKEPDKLEEYGINIKYGVGVVGTENGRWENSFNVRMKRNLYQADRFSPSNVVGYKQVNVIPQSVNEGVVNNNGEDFGGIRYEFYYQPDIFKRSAGTGVRSYQANGGWVRHYKNFQRISNYNVGLYGNLRKKTIYGNVNQSYEYIYGPKVIDLINLKVANINTSKIREVFYKSWSEPGTTTITQEQVFAYEQINYRLQSIISKGVENSIVQLLDYDFWNGMNKKTSTMEPVEFNARKDFAYKNNPSMGSKFLDASNTNQISIISKNTNSRNPEQNGYTVFDNSYYTRKLDTDGTYKFVNSTASNWSSRSAFSNNNDVDTTNWVRTSKATMYNELYDGLEQIDRKGNFSASKYDLENLRVIASASNCNYRSFFASSFEETVTENGITYFDNELNQGQTSFLETSTIEAHTGEYMAKIPASQVGTLYELKVEDINYDGETLARGVLKNRTYEASVWVHQSSPNNATLVVDILGENGEGVPISSNQSISRGSPNALQVGDWILLKLQFFIPNDFETPNASDRVAVYLWNNDSGQDAYFDDFRLQPINSIVQSTVYDKRRGLPLYVLNNENFYTRFVYDAAGNVIESYQETENGEKKIQENTIHFAQ